MSNYEILINALAANGGECTTSELMDLCQLTRKQLLAAGSVANEKGLIVKRLEDGKLSYKLSGQMPTDKQPKKAPARCADCEAGQRKLDAALAEIDELKASLSSLPAVGEKFFMALGHTFDSLDEAKAFAIDMAPLQSEEVQIIECLRIRTVGRTKITAIFEEELA